MRMEACPGISTSFPTTRSSSPSPKLDSIWERLMDTIFSFMEVTVSGNFPWVTYIVTHFILLCTM